jgi:MoaA/NifB/PqqE/SkfB family radical SAM enzyme
MENQPEKIILYGINDHSDLMLNLLVEKGVKPTFYCDDFVKTRTYQDYGVIPPEELLNHKDAHVIVASIAFLHSVTRYLKTIGHAKYSYANSFFNDEDLKNKRIVALNERYQSKLKCFEYEFFIENLDVVVTEKCTLRCVGCSNLISHYGNPQNYDFDSITGPVDLLLNHVDFIGEFRLLGGELFINKDTHRVILRYCDSPKIGRILIYTNGTLIPDAQTIETLKSKKVFVRISGYKQLSRNIDKLMQIFKDENIRYDIAYPSEWQDLGELKFRNYTESELEISYKECQCRDIPTLLKNKIYPCPYAAHGVNLGVIPENDFDSIDIVNREFAKFELKRALEKIFFEQKYLTSCGYCSGRNFNVQGIEPAIQKKRAKRDE